MKHLSKYPIYVISKGRWRLRHTSRALEKMGVPYRIVIEPQEFDQYAAVIDPSKILVLPFSNLGKGSIPARNWVWEHSMSEGHERHWILDDNIRRFCRAHKGKRITITKGASSFVAIETFVDRYLNIALAGMQYTMFATPQSAVKWPYKLNERVYSCILIDNKIPFRWRGRYNEDTDLNLRAMKAGYCTVLFYTLTCDKLHTMTQKGGNTDELYKQDGQFDGRLEMARSLVRQHPDVTTIRWKWGRWQHHVDYSRFRKNALKMRPGVVLPEGSDDFGLRLVSLADLEQPDIVHASEEAQERDE